MIKQLIKGALMLIGLACALCKYIEYTNVRAEADARDFCDRMPLGVDIVTEIEKFEIDIGYKKVPGGKVSASHYGFPDEGFAKDAHTFMFQGVMFDKAYCEVSLADGKVTGKKSYFLYD